MLIQLIEFKLEIKRKNIVDNRENIGDVKLTDTQFVKERESRYVK